MYMHFSAAIVTWVFSLTCIHTHTYRLSQEDVFNEVLIKSIVFASYIMLHTVISMLVDLESFFFSFMQGTLALSTTKTYI